MTAENQSIAIRPFEADDWAAVWRILEPVFRAGETYPLPTDITEVDARAYWIDNPLDTFVAQGSDGSILGTYYIRPNQPGLGAHVCNCGYMVSQDAQGQGVATALNLHSQATAKTMGFRAMQYNMVVSTNERAVRLWQHLGFTKVGTLPGAFHHQRLGYVDAHVLFKSLE